MFDIREMLKGMSEYCKYNSAAKEYLDKVGEKDKVGLFHVDQQMKDLMGSNVSKEAFMQAYKILRLVNQHRAVGLEPVRYVTDLIERGKSNECAFEIKELGIYEMRNGNHVFITKIDNDDRYPCDGNYFDEDGDDCSESWAKSGKVMYADCTSERDIVKFLCACDFKDGDFIRKLAALIG